MERKRVLFEISFWEQFSKRYPSFMPLLSIDAIKEAENWFAVFSFLGRSDTIWNCSAQLFNEMAQKDKNLSFLWKKHTQGECGIEFMGDYFSDLRSTLLHNLTSTIFTNTDYTGLASAFGLININTDNYQNKAYLFRDNGIALKKHQQWNWSNLRESIPDTSNAMIIVDNYVFQNVQNNLKDILDILLPDQLSVPYHISVFSSDITEDRITSLKQRIQQIRPRLTVKIDFIRTTHADFHDRVIITNNVWISSGSGFDLLLPNGARNSTTISIVYPHFGSERIQWIDQAYNIILFDARKALRIREMVSDNRLLC